MNVMQFLYLSLGGNVFLLAFILVIVLFMKREGLFFLSRSFGGKGIDLVSVEPESRALHLKTIKWTGRYFENAKEAIFFGFDPLLNPDTDSKKAYNDALNYTCYWAGSKRPVVFGSEAISFVFNPHLALSIKASRDFDHYNKIASMVGNLNEMLEHHINKVSLYHIFKPDNIREYLNSGSTPIKNRMVYDKGKMSGILQMTRKRDLGPILKFAIPIGIIFLLILLYSQGVFSDILPGPR